MSEIVSFGEWVQQRRNQLRFSRTVLASQIGCSPVTIKKIERDERRPSPQVAELLAIHLEIPKANREDFMRRARGIFVPTFGAPAEMSLAEAQAPTQHDEALKHNLRPQATSFIGRQTELAAIAARLSDPNCRLLTILGAGGMGKTSLSIAAATTQLEHFTDGVYYIALAAIPAATAEQQINPLATALADILGISINSGSSPEEQILTIVAQKEMLLIYDNFEHLLNQALFLTDLLTAAPDIKILITSRERLNLQQEWLFPLQGLPFSASDHSDADGSAPQLFKQRALQLKPSFDFEQEREAILQICQLVDGMPLALELAASWVHHLSCTAIAQEIQAEIDFLSSQAKNVPARHRSIRALFSYSWQQLSEQERLVLQRMSIFRGGFDRVAARSVTQASLPMLQSLVDKSLLTVAEKSSTDSSRYQIHELLRQFAAEKLAESAAEISASNELHCRYFLSLVAGQEPILKGNDALNAIRTIEADIDNIRQALRWGATHHLDLFDRHVGISLEIFFNAKGLSLEAEALFRLIADRLKGHCQPDAFPDQTTISPTCLLWAQYQANVGNFQLNLGQPHKAVATLEQTLSLLSGDAPETIWTRCWCLLNLGAAIGFIDSSPYDEPYRQCGEIIHRANDPWLQGFYLVNYGQRALEMGALAHSQQLLEQGISLLETIGARLFLTYAQTSLGRLVLFQGNLDLAETINLANLKEQTELGLPAGTAWSLANVGNIKRLQGNYQRALDYYQQSLALSREINLQYAQAIVLLGLSKIALNTGDFTAANHYFQESQQIMPLSEFAGVSGFAAIGLGEFTRAEQIFRDMLTSTMTSNVQKGSLEAIVGFAYLEAKAERFGRAIELLAFVRQHPAMIYETELDVRQLWDELVSKLLPDVIAQAEARGKELTLVKTAEMLLAGSPRM